MMRPAEVERFCQHLRNRSYSRHSIASYALDLQLFFAEIKKPVSQITWREVDHFIEQQHGQGLAATTINRRLHAIKRFFDYLVVETERLPTNPVKPSHFLKQGRPLPKKLSGQQVKRLFATISNRMGRALFLLMLRCGLRVSEVAQLKVQDIDWEQKALLVRQGKGRKDRRVYLSAHASEGLQECLVIRPALVPGEHFFWNQKRKG
jgi:site-specific recombinase XerD